MLTELDARTFTNTKGNTMKADLVSMEGDTVVFKQDSGRRVKIPLSSLTEVDRIYIKNWWEKNKDKVNPDRFKLAIASKNARIGKTSSKGKGQSKGKSKDKSRSVETSTIYTCKLDSYSPKTIKEVTAVCTIYKRVSKRGEGGSSSEVHEVTQRISIGTLEAKRSATFETKGVKCLDSYLKPKSGKNSSHRESIVGMIVTLSANGHDFLEQSYPKNFLGRQKEEEERLERREKQSRE